MPKIQSWEEFAKAAERLYQSDPSNVRYNMKYRHCNGNLLITVTDDQVRLQYETQPIPVLHPNSVNKGMADEDATVEVEDEGYGNIDDAQPQVINNQNPNFMMSLYTNVCSYCASYGWPAIFIIVVVILLWSNFEKQVRKWLEKKSDEHSAANMDPELLARRAEAMERARQNMQEKASAIIKKEAERRRELEEKKRQERIADFDAFKHGQSSHATQRRLGRLNDSENAESSSGSKKKKPPVNPLRSDFNPLTGTSSSARYRPAPRRMGGG